MRPTGHRRIRIPHLLACGSTHRVREEPIPQAHGTQMSAIAPHADKQPVSIGTTPDTLGNVKYPFPGGYEDEVA